MTEDAPFLSIVTRHMASRPRMFARCLESLKVQTCQDFEHVVLADEVGRGMAWANRQFFEHRALPQGEYVLILDDDDELATPEAVAILKAAAEASQADIIVFYGEHGERLGRLPTANVWGKAPLYSQISGQDFITRREVWYRHIAAYGAERAGDFAFLSEVWRCGYCVHWLGDVLVRAEHHFGAAE